MMKMTKQQREQLANLKLYTFKVGKKREREKMRKREGERGREGKREGKRERKGKREMVREKW